MALFIIQLLLTSLFAQTEGTQDLSQINPLQARAFTVSKEIKAGELLDIQVELSLQEGFFAYEERFRLEVESPEGLRVGELFVSPIVDFDDSISKKRKRGLKGQGTLKAQIEIPPDLSQVQEKLDLILTYIACTEKYCLTPRQVPLSLSVVIHPQKAATWGSTDFIQEQIEESLWFAFLLIFFFGLLTSLTPCVYPLIPITMAVLGTQKSRKTSQSFLISLVYVLGIGLTYALLGVIAAQTGQLFGSLISHPLVVITMSLLFIAMGLSLLGLFELQAPAFLRNRLAGTQDQRGYLGAFTSGLLAGVIASPCVGPVLVGILAYIARTQNSLLGFFLLFTFAMGFGVLFILLGTFSQLVNKLPRSGAWMNLVKYLLAFVLFGLAFYYSAPLLKQLSGSRAEKTQAKHSAVQWLPFSDETLAKAKEAGKPVMIDFFAEWCVACVEMDELTFSQTAVIEKSRDFVMLKVDATLPSKEINQLQSRFKVFGLPTFLFIGADGLVIESLTLTGFEEETPFLERMDKALKTIPDNAPTAR